MPCLDLSRCASDRIPGLVRIARTILGTKLNRLFRAAKRGWTGRTNDEEKAKEPVEADGLLAVNEEMVLLHYS